MDFLKIETLKPDVIQSLKKADSAVVQELAKSVKNKLDSGTRAILMRLQVNGQCPLTVSEISKFTAAFGNAMGEPLVQNDNGDRIVTVYDRDRLGSMNQGARYHQTREGGSIHTDNVNIPEPWRYLILSCLAPGEVGGESIAVDGIAIHEKLKMTFPKALKTLEANFFWERRGVGDTLYEAPIITYDSKGQPHFRHLRPYMESAHQKAGVPMTLEQLYAIDVLDALTNSSEYQQRILLLPGDHMISIDSQVLHGRTCFSDSLEAVNLKEFIEGKGKTLKRTMERLWIK